jgi:hypothetical protein
MVLFKVLTNVGIQWSYLEIRCIFLSPDFSAVIAVTSLCADFFLRWAALCILWSYNFPANFFSMPGKVFSRNQHITQPLKTLLCVRWWEGTMWEGAE